MTSNDFRRNLEDVLLERYGPVLSGDNLIKCLGYPSKSAFQKAISRKTVPEFVFTIPNRKGRFALCTDLAAWLEESRNIIEVDNM